MATSRRNKASSTGSSPFAVFLGVLFLLAILLAAAGAFLVLIPYGPDSETFVDIPSGTGTQAIAVQLEAAHVIPTRYAFDLLHLWREFRNPKSPTLKAGEYRFDHPVPLTEVYTRIVHGDVYTRTLVIPEGFNIFDIAQAVEAAGLGSRAAFLDAARQHTELIAAILPAGAPRPASLEGYLFPDTYHFSRHTTPTQMLTTMVHRFRQAAVPQLDGANDNNRDLPRTVLLASLIEKEVSQSSERPLVAGVFLNRLAQGMPLATDPTVIYAALLEGRWRGTIHASDLQSRSPYNTYRHAGLPPGPICNPGIASLQAALHPAETNYLYFVADAAGHSRFSVGLKEHTEQTQAYRQALNSPPGAPKPPNSNAPGPRAHPPKADRPTLPETR